MKKLLAVLPTLFFVSYAFGMEYGKGMEGIIFTAPSADKEAGTENFLLSGGHFSPKEAKGVGRE